MLLIVFNTDIKLLLYFLKFLSLFRVLRSWESRYISRFGDCLCLDCIEFYADDITLLACSCLGPQKLINIYMEFCLQWDIRFNSIKSQIACFGSKSPVCDCINIGGKFIKWLDRIKCLGCYFRCGRIEVDSSSYVSKFHGAFNNILNVVGSRKDKMLAVHLVKNILSSLLAVQLWNVVIKEHWCQICWRSLEQCF